MYKEFHMQKRFSRPVLSVAMVGGLTAALTWSNDCQACAVETYLSTVCIMALAGGPAANGFGGTYVPAAGQKMTVSQNAALYSLLGSTYGGDAQQTYFNLPDLRGRTVIGAGTYNDPKVGPIQYKIGATGGAVAIGLTLNQLPPHVHTVKGVTVAAGPGNLGVSVDFSSVKATTSLTGVTATTSLSGVTATADGSRLSLQANSGNGGGSSPSGTSLATINVPSAKLYSTSAPNVAMMAGSIAGTAPVTFSGSPTTTLNGTPTTALTGSPTSTMTGAPSVALGGQTDVTGAGGVIGIMPPYLAMTYFIATNNALYPASN